MSSLGDCGPPPGGKIITKFFRDAPGPHGERWSLGWRIDRLGSDDYGNYIYGGEESEQITPLMAEVLSELFDNAVNFLHRHYEEHYALRYEQAGGGE